MPPSDLFGPQSPPASMQPVEFDFGAAAAAAAALRDAAQVVDRSARARVVDARDAERLWSGGQRLAFDKAEVGLSSAASDLVTALRKAAQDLHDQAGLARAENARRATALAGWNRDLETARRHYVEAQARLVGKG